MHIVCFAVFRLTISHANIEGKGLLTRILCGPELLTQVTVFTESSTMHRDALASLWLDAVASLQGLFCETHGVQRRQLGEILRVRFRLCGGR